MLGWDPGSLAGQAGMVVWPSAKDYETVGTLIGPKLAYRETVDFEWTLRKRDGAQLLARIRARAIDDEQPTAGGTIWIIEDITQRRAFELALADARDAAETANRSKSAFLANMSHELRTPLNGVIGLARLALDPDLPPARKDKYLQGVIDSAQTLTRIVSDILDLSKIEAGKLAIEDDDFDLHALIDTIETTYSQLATEKGLEFGVQRSDDVPRFVRGDALRVRQILGNFLSNALKFTSRGRIDLGVERVADGLRMSVRDTGIGIDMRTQERLFARFTQADASTTRRFGGTGLGLSICRQLARLMKGAVGVESTPGAGSTFWAILPLPAAAAPMPDGARADGANLAGMHVLLVEDNEVNMLIAEAMLQAWGVVVEQAGDGRAAIDAVERAFERGKPFDAVLMDVQMPVMSGYEATAMLRQRYDKQRLPIIALTAAALTTEQRQSEALGMNDFVAKPIDELALQAALARVRPAAPR
jgi:signal transduction histidine kinase/ActR/RegA family two-component response regulator